MFEAMGLMYFCLAINPWGLTVNVAEELSEICFIVRLSLGMCCSLLPVHLFLAGILNFCANNYLGLSSHPEVIRSGHEALEKFGAGLSSVRFICGTQVWTRPGTWARYGHCLTLRLKHSQPLYACHRAMLLPGESKDLLLISIVRLVFPGTNPAWLAFLSWESLFLSSYFSFPFLLPSDPSPLALFLLKLNPPFFLSCLSV